MKKIVKTLGVILLTALVIGLIWFVYWIYNEHIPDGYGVPYWFSVLLAGPIFIGLWESMKPKKPVKPTF